LLFPCSSSASFDFGYAVVGEVEVRGAEDRVDLRRAAETDDSPVDRRVAQRRFSIPAASRRRDGNK
jgi:hypothetical protein